MTEFTSNVIEIIKQIPSGKVMTYGQIANYAGNPWGARQVARILHSLSNAYQLPWYRVINSKGEISLTGEGGFIQMEKLAEEGIITENGKLDLSLYLHEF